MPMTGITVNDGIPSKGVLQWHGIEEGKCEFEVTGSCKRGNEHVIGVVVPLVVGHGLEQVE